MHVLARESGAHLVSRPTAPDRRIGTGVKRARELLVLAGVA